jgi:hypothetical protein
MSAVLPKVRVESCAPKRASLIIVGLKIERSVAEIPRPMVLRVRYGALGNDSSAWLI